MLFTSWLRKRTLSRAVRRRAQRPSAAPRFRPRLEALEDRCLLSAGSLDPTFGNGGLVTTDFTGPTNDIELAGTAIQPDGKIVLAGSSEPTASLVGGGFALARYNSDGSLDTTFGNGGEVLPNYGNFTSRARAVALQGDGKIVTAGWAYTGTSTDFAVKRYNSDGSLDTTFGNGGEVLTAFGSGFNEASAIAIQGDGKIVVAGESAQGNSLDFALVRYNSDGSLDTTFGNGGEVLTAFGSDTYQVAHSLAIQSNGDIVAAGESYTGTSWNFALARYTPSGSLDTSFGSAGQVLTALGNTYSEAAGVTIQGDGKIVASGTAYTGTSLDFALVRYNSDGSLDPNFGTGGEVTTDFGSQNNFGEQTVIQSNGDIVAAGFSYQRSTGTDFALARYTPGGDLDTTFGNGGKVLTDFGHTYDYATGVALQTNGDIVAGGESVQPATGYDFAVARYTPSGSLDTTFNSTGPIPGTVVTNIGNGPTDDYGRAGVALQADGKLVVAGAEDRGFFNGGDEFALARYNKDGSLDTTFGNNGEVVTDFGGQAVATSVAIQDDGKIVVGGQTLQVVNGYYRVDFALARYNSNGSLDTTFGNGGKVITDFSQADALYGVAIQSDGSIVVAGQTLPVVNGYYREEFTLARYKADGSLDTTFGNGGEVLTDFTSVGGSGGQAYSVAIQPNGEIVAAGLAFLPKGGDDFGLARFNPDGTPDASFGNKNSGEVLTSIGYAAWANSVAIQSDGRIVAAGTASQPKTFALDFAVARYNSDGSLDTSFGNKGEVVTNFGSSDNEALAMALQSDGRIVVAGESYSQYTGYDFALARYNSDGSLDQGFGNGGLVTTYFGGISQAVGVVIQFDGNIVAAGTAYQPGQGFDFALARYIGVAPSTPIDLMDGIITNVQTLAATGVLNNGQGNSLQSKLQHAIEDLNDGQTTTALNDLQAFINEVNDYISEDILSSIEGQQLIDETEAVIALIEQE